MPRTRLFFGELSFPAWCGILKRSNHTAARRKGAPLKWRTAQNGALCQAYGKNGLHGNVVKGLFGSMTNPDIISFSGGSPAREALPVDTIRQLADEVLRTDTRGVEALQYGPH